MILFTIYLIFIARKLDCIHKTDLESSQQSFDVLLAFVNQKPAHLLTAFDFKQIAVCLYMYKDIFCFLVLMATENVSINVQ